MKLRSKILAKVGLVFSISFVRIAIAGPPYLTDDPVTLSAQQWQFYYFAATDDQTNLGTSVFGPAVETDYGLIKNLTLQLIAGGAASFPQRGPNTFGVGDTQTAVEYRFLQETNYLPQVAIFPAVIIPTGNGRRDLGNGDFVEKLPIWAQKSWGPWTVDTGGGYEWSQAKGEKNFIYGGFLLQRNLSKRLSLGAEIFSEGASAINEGSFTTVNCGETYRLTKNLSFLASIGHTILGEKNIFGYVGLYYSNVSSATATIGKKHFLPKYQF